MSMRPLVIALTRPHQSSNTFWFTEPACHSDCIFQLCVCAWAPPAPSASASKATAADSMCLRFMTPLLSVAGEALHSRAAIKDLRLPLGDGVVEGEHLGLEVAPRPRLVLEVVVVVAPAH